MKMTERIPVHFSCRNHRLLTCLTLVSLVVTTTLGNKFSEIKPDEDLSTSARQSGPLTNGSNLVKTSASRQPSHQTQPPISANFVMQCQPPSEYIWDHCWLDDNTIISVHYEANKVYKATLNRQNKTCTFSELGSPPGPRRVACSPDGEEIYVVNYDNSPVWVFDKNNFKAVWEPEGLVGMPKSLALNRYKVLVGTHARGPLYVYNRNRVYTGQVWINQNQFAYEYTHLTEEGLFVASTEFDGHRLIIHDLVFGSTVTVGGKGSENGKFNGPVGVSTVGNYKLVSDRHNLRVPVISKYGKFQSNLQFKGADVEIPLTSEYRSETSLWSIIDNGRPGNKIKIFTLTY